MKEEQNSINPFTREDLPVKSLISGHHLSVPVFRYKGQDPRAPKVYIQANVHGAELQGNAVIYELMNYLKTNPAQGDIVLIPQANPYGENLKMGEYTFGRFDPTTGKNWNRGYYETLKHIDLDHFVTKHAEDDHETIKNSFKKELKLALEKQIQKYSEFNISTINKLTYTLQEISQDADIVLDLHTGPKAGRYLYSADYQRESARFFGISQNLLIPTDFAGAMDEANFNPWVELKKAFFQVGRDDIPYFVEAYTVELGSEENFSLADGKEDLQMILNYLTYKNVFSGNARDDLNPNQYACLLKDYRTIHTPKGGLIDFKFSPGDKVNKDDVMFETLSFNNILEDKDLDNALTSYTAPADCLIVGRSASCSMHEGMEAYNVMFNYEKL